MNSTLQCYRCGASLAALSLPLGRLEECPGCEHPLHVCRMCRHFDPGVTKQCREDDAEEVREKERPNFCDYFRPRENAYDPRYAAGETRARDQLANLFGEEDATKDSEAGGEGSAGAADDLFK